MKKLIVVLFLGSSLMLMGCAAKTDIQYSPPSQNEGKNSRVYSHNVEQVWDAAIKAVGEQFFVLDNIERDSKIITLSFSSQDPNSFVDCGKFTVTNSGGMSGKGVTSYYGAQSRAEFLVADDTPHPKPSSRTTSLSGKSNILVSSEGTTKTKVSVMTRYVLDVSFEGVRYIPVGFSGFNQSVRDSDVVSFNCGETGRSNKGSAQCVSRFTLEKNILDAIEAKLR